MGVASDPGDVTFVIENIKKKKNFFGLRRIKPDGDVNVRILYTGWGVQGAFCVIL